MKLDLDQKHLMSSIELFEFSSLKYSSSSRNSMFLASRTSN